MSSRRVGSKIAVHHHTTEDHMTTTGYPTKAHERIGRTLGACHAEHVSAESREYRLELALQGLTVPALIEYLEAEGVRFVRRPKRAEVLEAMAEVLGIGAAGLK